MSKKFTQKEVLDRFKKVHGDEYDYSLVEYVNTDTKISIICKKDGHGVFQQTPYKHLIGRGCPDCGNIKQGNSKRKTKEDFVKQAKEVHPDKNYGYEKVVYVNAFTKVVIVCPVHGDFPQLPNNHMQGKGCPKCTNKREGRIAIILNEIGVVHRNHRITNRFFDFYLPEYNLIIERDGEQHYFNTFRFRGKRKKVLRNNIKTTLKKQNWQSQRVIKCPEYLIG